MAHELAFCQGNPMFKEASMLILHQCQNTIKEASLYMRIRPLVQVNASNARTNEPCVLGLSLTIQDQIEAKWGKDCAVSACFGVSLITPF